LTENDKVKLNVGNEEIELSPEQLKFMAKEAAIEKANDAQAKKEEEEAAKLEAEMNGLEAVTADASANEF